MNAGGGQRGDLSADGFAFKKAHRLLKTSEYGRVFDKTEARASHKHLLLLARRNAGEHDRLGLVVAKKHVRLAVRRNRITRLVREFFRQRVPGRVPLDVIFLARAGIDQLDNAALSTLLRQQWQKLADQLPPCKH